MLAMSQKTKQRRIVTVSESGRWAGESHPFCRHSQEDIDLMRELYEEHNMAIRLIAEKFESSYSYVWEVVTYRARTCSCMRTKEITN